MERGYLLPKRIAIIFFSVYFLFSVFTVVAYYPLRWDDLMYQMELRMSWKRLKMETVVQVFDPFAEIEEKGIEKVSKSYEAICNYIQSEMKW